MSYVDYFGSTVLDKVSTGASVVTSKLHETGITEKVSHGTKNLGDNLYYYGSAAAGYTKSSIDSATQSAQDGSLATKTVEKTTAAASQAKEMLGTIGYSLFSKVKDLSATY